MRHYKEVIVWCFKNAATNKRICFPNHLQLSLFVPLPLPAPGSAPDQLQQDINNLVAWANKWQLNFNVSKCHLLHFGKPHNYGSYSINGIQISPNDSIKDLGVIVDNQLKFHEHADSVVTKANRTLAIIRKSFNFTDKTMFLSLYKSLVRPIIEYGNAIWGPHYILDQQSIESVQRRFTKYLFNFNDLPYS